MFIISFLLFLMSLRYVIFFCNLVICIVSFFVFLLLSRQGLSFLKKATFSFIDFHYCTFIFYFINLHSYLYYLFLCAFFRINFLSFLVLEVGIWIIEFLPFFFSNIRIYYQKSPSKHRFSYILQVLTCCTFDNYYIQSIF